MYNCAARFPFKINQRKNKQQQQNLDSQKNLRTEVFNSRDNIRGQFVYPTQGYLASRFHSNLFRQVCRSRSEDSLRKNLNFFIRKQKKSLPHYLLRQEFFFFFAVLILGKGFKGTKMQRERQQEQVEHDESMEENVGPLPINKLEVTRLDKTNVLHQKREDYFLYLLRIKV